MVDPVPRVTVIVVTYESLETVGATLESLKPGFDAGLSKVVLVDNASADGTADFVASTYPWVVVRRSPGNIGFGRGCNLGLEGAATPYVLFLNPDATLELASLLKLMDFMENHEATGIVGPAVIEKSGDLQPSGALPSPLNVILKPLLPGWASRNMRHVAPGEAPHRTDWICGSIMLVRQSMIDQIGAFDPRFFLYFEESDLCKRAQTAGWQIWTVGEAVGSHVNAASVKKVRAPMMWGAIPEHFFRSRFYYLKKHHGWILATIAEVGELISMTLRAGLERVRGLSYPHFSARLQAPILKLPPIAERQQADACAGNVE